ncbi:probable tubulin polyglutamylase ttll-15 isoform X2 [Amphiura filiformis]|uniref:probable tubulin polyglutamylase ttll-15 isoform X2 n=1 Tax=Amphiura filiformis TaxID=82378 RepID=UPI003B212432
MAIIKKTRERTRERTRTRTTPDHVDMANRMPNNNVMKCFTAVFKPLIFTQLVLCTILLWTQVDVSNHCNYAKCIVCNEPSKMPILRLWSSTELPDYFDNIQNIFNRLGYRNQPMSGSPSWDVYWCHEYPGREFFSRFVNARRSTDPAYQKVNHFPGIGEIVTKSRLVKEGGKFIPPAFLIPEEKDAFFKEVNDNAAKNRTWMQKGRHQGGVLIKDTKDLDLKSPTIIQEFVANPFLIEGYKFNMGVYIVLTSINPLRAYILDSTVSLRFGGKKYIHGNYVDGTTYNTDIKGRQMSYGIASIWTKLKRFAYGRIKTLNHHFQEKGNSSIVRKQIYEAVRDVLVTRERPMQLHKNSPPNSNNVQGIFFEIMRCDFLIDDNLGVHLIEINMSPDLSADSHPSEKIFKEHVGFNCFHGPLLTDVRKHGVRSRIALSAHIVCRKKLCTWLNWLMLNILIDKI